MLVLIFGRRRQVPYTSISGSWRLEVPAHECAALEDC
ncbi:hypothetical protein AG1IA_09489 [Rhizoctonia solani AG-1 IA]|uniref:Uncharacterized protein n=1 Tax=Thanatephorus cucumeris (strain AG1-IA) TaxID=983506 RepID=L8WET9_THACA|nr:hypothetical protein AG1IA_09489 [Rhizoctonia solani AG-1 IA]